MPLLALKMCENVSSNFAYRRYKFCGTRLTGFLTYVKKAPTAVPVWDWILIMNTFFRPSSPSLRVYTLLMLLPTVREMDIVLRRHWLSLRREARIPINKLLLEMLEAGNGSNSYPTGVRWKYIPGRSKSHRRQKYIHKYRLKIYGGGSNGVAHIIIIITI